MHGSWEIFRLGQKSRSSNVKMVADRHRHAAYHNKHWRWVSQKC